MLYGSIEVTKIAPAHAANLVANSGNTAYGVDVIRKEFGMDYVPRNCFKED